VTTRRLATVGGIYNGTGAVTLDSSFVIDNTAGLDSGGIFNNAGTVTLDSSTVSGNIPNNSVNVPGC